MGLLARIDRHARLVDRMADALGVDLGEEAMMGRMRPEDLRSAVLRCTGCSHVDACDTWLTAHPDGATAAPDYCRNKQQLERVGRL